jgi:mycothiol synthase
MSLSPETSAALLALADAAATADGVAPLDEATVLAVQHRPDTLWADVRPQGFALRNGAELSVVVAPEARGNGLGSMLMASALEQAAIAGITDLTAWMHGDSPAARALAARAGFGAERELWVMRRDTAAAGALPVVDVPAEITLRGFRSGDEDELLRVNAAAFSWHPEQGAMDAENLRERMAQPWFTPADLIEAWEGERLLGFHWTKQHSATLGEIYVVGVDPAAQGRGLGRLLTIAGLRHMADLPEVHLYVESDNAPAVGLYESLGFTHTAVDTHVQFARYPQAAS